MFPVGSIGFSAQQHPLLSASVLCALVLSGCASTTQTERSGQTASGTQSNSYQVQQLTTPDGHEFWHHSMPNADRTAVAITWQSELPDESAMPVATPRLGIELMLNGGAGGLSPETIIADFEDLDSGARLWVQPQEISGFVVAPKRHMERAAEIANTVLTDPNFDQQWFDREKTKLLDNATNRQSLIMGLAWNLFRETALNDHPYKRFWSLRPVEAIDQISMDNVENWHQQAFSTSSMSVTAAGNASVEELATQIDTVLRGMPSNPVRTQREFSRPDVKGKTILLHQADAPKSAIVIVGTLPDHSEGVAVPIQLGLGVLGHGKQSRLFKAVRSGLRAAYGFSAGQFTMTRSHKLFHMGGEVETAKLKQALDETENAYEKFRLGGVGVIEFPIAKRFYRQNLDEEMKKPESIAFVLMEAKRNGDAPEALAELNNQVASLDRSEVNRLIKTHFPPFDSTMRIVVTPDKNAVPGACVITDIDQWRRCE